jgi:hypothetical protein
MPFSDFTNPYQNPANIPQNYRQDINLRKLFKADGSYVRPAEDPVTMWALQILLEEYGVPLEAMELELNADFAEGTHQGGRRYQGRVDIVVYDDRYADSVGNLDVAFIMVEAMEPNKKVGGTEGEGWVDHLNRLNAYMSASLSARYAILTSGKHTVNDYVGDPACGSARMLTHVLDYVRKQEYAKAIANNGGSAEGINPEEPTEEFIKFRDNHLFGAEYSRNVMRVARVNTLINGAQYADLKVMDSLERLGNITGGITEGLPEYPGFYLGGLTMILTNPPFGSKLTNESVLKDFAERDGVTKKNGKVVKSIPQEVAFLNRCLEYLAPKGKLAIVLPDGILANSSMQDVRDWILRWTRLRAVISLPQETFMPYGAGVKTSVILLEKREFEQVNAESDEDYEIYMARIDDIGYDKTGRITSNQNQKLISVEIQEVIDDLARCEN